MDREKKKSCGGEADRNGAARGLGKVAFGVEMESGVVVIREKPR